MDEEKAEGECGSERGNNTCCLQFCIASQASSILPLPVRDCLEDKGKEGGLNKEFCKQLSIPRCTRRDLIPVSFFVILFTKFRKEELKFMSTQGVVFQKISLR